MDLQHLLTAARSIESHDLAADFIGACIEWSGGGWHPDDGFLDLIDLNTGQPSVPDRLDAEELEQALTKAWSLLDESIYDVALFHFGRLYGAE